LKKMNCPPNGQDSQLFNFWVDGLLWLADPEKMWSNFEHSQNRYIADTPFGLGV
jgi:hypothetical protein